MQVKRSTQQSFNTLYISLFQRGIMELICEEPTFFSFYISFCNKTDIWSWGNGALKARKTTLFSDSKTLHKEKRRLNNNKSRAQHPIFREFSLGSILKFDTWFLYFSAFASIKIFPPFLWQCDKNKRGEFWRNLAQNIGISDRKLRWISK